MALSTLARTDLLGTLPRHMVQHGAAQFGLATVGLDVLKRQDLVCAIATRAAVMDADVAWMFDLIKSFAWDAQRSSIGRDRSTIVRVEQCQPSAVHKRRSDSRSQLSCRKLRASRRQSRDNHRN